MGCDERLGLPPQRMLRRKGLRVGDIQARAPQAAIRQHLRQGLAVHAYRREGSNPSFSAKKPENAEFSGFFDALNLLLLQTPKKESGEKLDKMACYFTRYFTRPFLLLHSYFTFWGLLSISIHQIPGHKFPLFFYHFVCSFLLFIAYFIIMIINIE